MEQVAKRLLSIDEASRELGLSPRQVLRIKKRYREEGQEGVISKRRGKPNVRRISEGVRKKVVKALYDPLWGGWGPTFAKEKLEETHKIHVSVETLRKWMVEEGLWKRKKKKEVKIYQRRTRRSRFGQLLQGDGSHHDWFEGRGEKCALLIFVDDATSKITSAKFTPSETTQGYLEILEEHLQKYGRPGSLYVDKHSIFRINQEKTIKGDGKTHFGRVLQELNIELICAHSPQAKGRVERANGTLQDRLTKEMRLKQVGNIEEGNRFLPKFIEAYNKKFGKEAASEEDGHLPLRAADDLERIFARKERRKLSKDLSFQYEGTLYQIQTKKPNRIRKTHAEIIERYGKPIIVEIGGKVYKYTQWNDTAYERTKILDCKELEVSWRSPQNSKPHKHHPWS